MKKFTKALALLMALAMVFALAACSGGGDTGESSNNNASEAPKSTFAPVAKGQIDQSRRYPHWKSEGHLRLHPRA